MTLFIPDLPENISTVAAAMAYAAAGWYVGPYDADKAKNPGGILGTGWHKQTSQDPQMIQWWWANHPHAAVFLHVGRSGAVAFDVDHPENVRADTELGHALAAHTGPVQLTRDEQRAAPLGGSGPLIYRAHYLFLQPAGRDIGNSRGLTHTRGIQSYGEVRGRNGVIVVAPSQHVHHGHGGIYRWLRTGPVPLLPPALAAQLRDAAPEIDAASLARVHQLRGSVTGSTDLALLARGPVLIWNDLVNSGQSRHDALTSALPFAYREALAGLYPMAHAEDELRRMFVEAVQRPDLGSGSVRSEDEANREFDAVSMWALGQAESADPAEVKAAALQRTYTEPLTVFDPGPIDARFQGSVGALPDVPVLAADPFGGPGKPAQPLVRQSPLPSVGELAGLRFTWAVQLRQRASRWLWEEGRFQWIPLGGLVLLGGREGVGKSTLAFKLAAGVTLGTLPGDCFGIPRSVVIAATEDAWEQTIQPRLIAAGADLQRVARVDVTSADGAQRGLSLVQDVPALREGCQQHDVALVLLDPLLSTVGGSLDTHKDSDVRKALEPLSRMAADLQLTVLGLIHQNKSTGSDILTRLMGSRAFSAVARAVLLCARKQEEELDDDTDPFASVVDPQAETFVFGQLKSNLGPPVLATIEYQIKGVTTGWDGDLDKPIRSSALEFGQTVPVKVTELVQDDNPRSRRQLGSNNQTTAAMEWLLEYLRAKGPTPSSICRDDALAEGHAKTTLYRAREKGGIQTVTVEGEQYWQAPPAYVAGKK